MDVLTIQKEVYETTEHMREALEKLLAEED